MTFTTYFVLLFIRSNLQIFFQQHLARPCVLCAWVSFLTDVWRSSTLHYFFDQSCLHVCLIVCNEKTNQTAKEVVSVWSILRNRNCPYLVPVFSSEFSKRKCPSSQLWVFNSGFNNDIKYLIWWINLIAEYQQFVYCHFISEPEISRPRLCDHGQQQ